MTKNYSAPSRCVRSPASPIKWQTVRDHRGSGRPAGSRHRWVQMKSRCRFDPRGVAGPKAGLRRTWSRDVPRGYAHFTGK
jgi:hypothetical protein